MRLIESLIAEHVLIDRVVGSLRTFVLARTAGGHAPGADGAAFVRFFRLYAGRFHEAREEQVLLPALVTEAEVPGERGPLLMLRRAHVDIGALLDELAPLLCNAAGAETGDSGRLWDLAARHGKARLHHIDAENSVLFPEGERRLRAAHVTELPDRAPDEEEAAARAEGEALALKYAPTEYPEQHRGDGCVACPDYGERCDGVEREWWSELEWEDFYERSNSG